MVTDKNTFETDLVDLEEVREKLAAIIDIMWKRCEAKEKTGRTVTLKLRFADFSQGGLDFEQQAALSFEGREMGLARIFSRRAISCAVSSSGRMTRSISTSAESSCPTPRRGHRE